MRRQNDSLKLHPLVAVRCHRLLLLVVFMCALLTPGLTHPQQREKTPPQTGPEFSISTDTQVVLVPVVVRDREGKHAAGIDKALFTLLQDGKAREIAFFEEIRPGMPRNPPRPRLGPGVYTNLRSENQPHNLALVLLDMLNTTPESQAQNRGELLRGLARSANQQTPTALLLLTQNGVRVVHDFTTSPALLLAAIDRVIYRRQETAGTQRETISTAENRDPNALNAAGPQTDPGSAGGMAARLDQIMNDLQSYMEGVAAPIATYKRGAAVASTLESLEWIAHSYAGVPGRKSLLWVTAGFPFEGLDESGLVGKGSVQSAYQKAMRALTDANVALYPIDVRGLVNVGIGDSPTRRTRFARDESPLLDSDYRGATSRISNIETMADITGGRAFYNTNDVGTAFESAAKDSSAYYLLGYYLKRENTKPGWHKLKVKVGLEKLEVRAREGFYVQEGDIGSTEARQTDILAALQAPVDYTQLPIILRWNHVESTPGGRKAAFDIDLPAGGVSPDEQNRLNLDFVVVASTSAGEKVRDFSQNFTATLAADGLRRITESGVTYSNSIVVPPGSYNVRVVVRDNVSGKTGSLIAPLHAP